MLENWCIRKTLKHTKCTWFFLRASFDAAPSSYRTRTRDPKSVGAAAGARGHEAGRGRAFVIRRHIERRGQECRKSTVSDSGMN